MSWVYPKKLKKSTPGGIRLAPYTDGGWGQRWVDAVKSFTAAKLLETGFRCAKAGHVLSIRAEKGAITAEVQGPGVKTVTVEIGLPMFTPKQCLRVAEALLKKAFYSAKLLAGDMPAPIEEIFRSAGAPLLPEDESDISTDCSCTDAESPCKHVTAAVFILGLEIDRDAFLLMEMRGLSRAQLLTEIHNRRTTGKNSETKPGQPPHLKRPAQTPLLHHLNTFFETPKADPGSVAKPVEELNELIKPGGRIHEMGAPPFWQSDNNFEEVMTRIYTAVRRHALSERTLPPLPPKVL